MAATRTFEIEINGVTQSVSAVDALLQKLEELENRIENLSDGGIDVSDLRSSLQSIRTSLEGNVEDWEGINDKIGDVTTSVERLEREFRNLDDPFDVSDIRDARREIDGVTTSLREASQVRLNGLNTTAADARQAEQAIGGLAGELERAQRAEDLLLNGINLNVGGMELRFRDVNQAIEVLRKKMQELHAAGQQDTQMYRDLSTQVAELSRSTRVVNAQISDLSQNTLQRFAAGIKGIAGIASIGTGIANLFGIDNKELAESIQKLGALMLIMQGVTSVQQQLRAGTSATAKVWEQFARVADMLLTPLTAVGNYFDELNDGRIGAVGKAMNNLTTYFDKLQAIKDLNFNVNLALNNEEAISGLRTELESISDQFRMSDEQWQEFVRDFVSGGEQLRDMADNLYQTDLIDGDQLDEAEEAMQRAEEALGDVGRAARRARGELEGMGLDAIPGSLTRMQRGLLAVRNGINAVSTAVKGLMRATIILGLIQAALEAITWVFDKVSAGISKFSGAESAKLVDAAKTQESAIDSLNKSLEQYTKNLQNMVDTKQISNMTRLTESMKEYERALKSVIQSQKELNAIRAQSGEDAGKALQSNLGSNNTWFTGADIKNIEDFTKQFNILQKAVTAGSDRFEALADATQDVKDKFGGNWFQKWWNTSSDAASDFAEAQKAVISDIQHRINNLDLSGGTDEVKKFIELLNTPMYAVSLANVEALFPEDKYAQVLNRNIGLIRDYYQQIQDMQAQAEKEAQATQDRIDANNVAAIRGRFARERAELENSRQKEVRDAADNAELIASINAKYATQRANMLKQQAREVTAAQNAINNNRIAAMKDGWEKQLAELNQQRKQEIDSARQSEVKVGEQIAAINAKYDKMILDAKKKFFDEQKKLLDDYAAKYRAMQNELYEIEAQIATQRITNRTRDRLNELGFTDETLDEIRKYYDQIAKIQNEEAKKQASVDTEKTTSNYEIAVEDENARNKERLKELEDYLNQGLILQEQYDEMKQQETEMHNQAIQMLERKQAQDLINIEKQLLETQKNNNATAINERINELSDMQSKIKAKIRVTSLGIIDYKASKKELTNAKNEYIKIFDEIRKERENLQKAFDAKEISFGDFRQAKKELDSLEESTRESVESINNQLDTLLTNTIESVTQLVNSYASVLGDLWSTYNDIQMARIEAEQERLEEEYDMLQKAYEKQEALTKKHTDKLDDIEEELKDSRGDRRAHLIQQLNAERAAMLASLAEEQKIQKQKDANEKKQAELEKKRKEQEKKNAIVQATINTFTAVTNALAVQPWFVGLALSAVALGLGMAYVAQIKSQKYAQGGLLKGPSHRAGGIPVGNTGIEVEGNEYVINKKSTSKNLPLIDYINRSDRTLTKDDIDRFFTSGKQNVMKNNSKMFAAGGQIPEVVVPEQDNTIVIEDDRPIVAQIVDIVDRADNYRQIQVLAGLEGSNSI